MCRAGPTHPGAIHESRIDTLTREIHRAMLFALMAPFRRGNIEHLRRAAKRARQFFDYTTARRSRRTPATTAASSTRSPSGLRVATARRDVRTTVLGTPLSLPVLLAPVGSSRTFTAWEEVAARAAGAGRSILSTPSGCSLEDVRRASRRAGLVAHSGGREVAAQRSGALAPGFCVIPPETLVVDCAE
jgi:hypothetical protein